MKIAFGSLNRRMLAASVLLLVAAACRTAGVNQVKDDKPAPAPIPGLSLQDWVSYCKSDLQDKDSQALMMQIAKTDDCTEVYRKVSDAIQLIAKQGSM